jgi:hypothetical protein
MYNASAFAMAQEILLTELYSMTPFDDAKNKSNGKRPDPNQIIASIDGDQLSIDTDTDAPAYAEVIDPETGETIAEEEFEGETTMSIPEEGDYEVYIYTESGTVMVGEFSVE